MFEAALRAGKSMNDKIVGLIENKKKINMETKVIFT